MPIKWLISSSIVAYQRRNRLGRIGFWVTWFGILGIVQRLLVQGSDDPFGGIPSVVFIAGASLTFLGWILSIFVPQRRL